MVNIFLTKIRLKGFKSFANQTDIELEENITAVVGPNGSGKSNIVDAVRWVLGEQSAKTLRGSRMSDIIFSGSEELNPKRSASVTLFFDNSDGILAVEGDELTLGREVDSDGKSDYLINGASCRLKDIEALLMDSGLGSDGYSIVGQGRIDSIIHSKADKLREFFEEAAGIMKHKSRKEDAEKRLENTQNDLNRIHDLFSELEKRREPLKNAAAKAKKFKKYKAELKDLELSLLNKKWQQLSEEFKVVAKDRNKAKKTMDEKESKYNSANYKLETKKDKLKLKKKEREENNSSYFQNQNKVNEINNNLNLLAERKKNYLEKKSELKTEQEKVEAEIEKKAELLAKSKENFAVINSDQKELKAKITELNNDLAELEAELQTAETAAAEKKEQIENFKSQIRSNDSLLERLGERVEITEQRLAEISEQKSALEAKIAAKTKEKRALSEKLEELKKELKNKAQLIAEAKSELSSQKEALEKGKEELISLKEDFQHCSSRLQLMEEMQENYEGYYNGVRAVLEKKDLFPELIDVVAEIVSVESEYEKALETALGAKSQNIIVENDAAAKKAVNYLKKQNKGRATFLPLNMINGSRLSDNYLSQLENYQGFKGLAVDLVDFPPRLENIFNYLLGQIVVSDNLDNAVAMAKGIKRSFRVVTQKGDVVYPGGAISGGSSTKNSRNLIGRSRKIEELKKEKAELKSRGEKLVGELKTLQKEIKAQEAANSNEIEELQSLKLAENNQENQLQRLKEELSELKENLGSLAENYQELKDKITENKNTITAKKEQSQKLKAEIKTKEAEIKALKEKIAAKKAEIEQLQPELKELELDGARISEKRDNAREKLEEKEAQLNKLKNEAAETEKKIAAIDADLKRIKNREQSLNEKKEDLESEALKLKKKKDELKQLVAELEAAVETREAEIKAIQNSLNELKDEFHELDLNYNKLKSELQGIEKILEEDYNLKAEEINESELIEIKAEAEAEVEAKIKELKKKLNQLHPVNEAAVEEFKELKDRLDYLHEQQNDLKHARRSIELVIDDIEESMEKMFSQTFYKVKEKFAKVFKALFQGGKAELKLTEPDDMLTTGVEIQAQPPGKSLKRLSLLSGGERALTAIALIFAFIQVKPSPFYVLDEIDAPLDDVNIVRFASFIKRYAKVAQFIIITHRRYMMTEVESLYGVTMEKSGVSRLISLKLDQDDSLEEEFIEEAL